MKSRARAIALARRRHRLPWPPWLLLVMLALALATVGAAQGAPAAQSQPEGAQAEATPKSAQGPIQQQPPAAGIAKAAPGVLKPQTNPDPGISLPTPNPKEFPTPVIKPPGTAGNPSPVIPK